MQRYIAKLPKVTVALKFHDDALRQIELLINDGGFYLQMEDASKSHSENAVSWLQAYAAKTQAPIQPFPFHFGKTSPFCQKVWQTLQDIPFGFAYSYQELAFKIGHPKAARAVGSACHKNPFPILIPCHRVIGKNAALGGFAFGLELKNRLLSFEGVHVRKLSC